MQSIKHNSELTIEAKPVWTTHHVLDINQRDA